MKGRTDFAIFSPGKWLKADISDTRVKGEKLRSHHNRSTRRMEGRNWKKAAVMWGGGLLLAGCTMMATAMSLKPKLEVMVDDSNPQLQVQRVEVSDFSEPLTTKGGPLLTSRSFAVIDAATHETLVARDADSPRPIASLTKLMSVMVYLDMAPDLTEVVEMQAEDRRGARPAHTRLQAGWKLTAYDLVHAALIASENPAVEALARSTGLTRAEFVSMMNRKAQSIGMQHSIFFDCSGLDANNAATANDVARMLDAAGKYPLIHQVATLSDYEATVLNTSKKLHYVNSNRLARYGNLDVIAGKTGYISDAGFCLTLSARVGGRELLMVFLNAPSKAARFADAARAASWVEEHASLAVAAR